MMQTGGKTVLAFNQVYLDFIKDVRHAAPGLNRQVGKAYKVFDRHSVAYVREFAPCARAVQAAVLALPDRVSEVPIPLDLGLPSPDVCRTVTAEQAYGHVTGDDARKLTGYLLALTAISGADDGDGGDDGGSLMTVLDCLRRIESGEAADMPEILDDDIRAVLEAYASVGAPAGAGAAAAAGSADAAAAADELLEKLGNSKIGQIAKEISAGIDMSKVNSPADLLNMGGAGGIGGMIKTVSDTINKKISDGSLRHEDLFSEAVDMVKMFGDTGLFKNINKAALSNMARKSDTRTRLREKVAARKTAAAPPVPS